MSLSKDATALNDLSWSYRTARVLQAANKFDIFTLLEDRQMSAEQISRAINSDPAMTEKLLIACIAMGLLEKQGSQFGNSQLARTYLVRGRELYQGDIIAHSATVWKFWDALPEAMLSGSSSKPMGPQEHEDFIRGMHNIAVTGRAKLFTDNVDLTGRKKLFDVGGGPGTYSIEACKHYHELQAVVFDLPETLVITKEIIAKEHLQNRISVQAGSWDANDFGNGNDVVLLSDVMHGPGSNAEMKLGKAYDSMVAGGLLVIQEFLLNDKKSGPLVAALFNLMVGAYSEAELLAMVENAGLRKAEVVAGDEKIGSSWITAVKK